MFTVADLRNIALQIEKNGEKTYRQAAQACRDPEMGRLFAKMADDEKQHAHWFDAIRVDKKLTDEQREIEAVGRSLLQAMIKDKTFSLETESLHNTENMETLLSLSEGFEKDTILFYEMLSGFIDDCTTMSQLQQIIAEEQNHLKELVTMAEQIA